MGGHEATRAWTAEDEQANCEVIGRWIYPGGDKPSDLTRECSPRPSSRGVTQQMPHARLVGARMPRSRKQSSPTLPQGGELLFVHEAAEYLRVSACTMRRYIRSGLLPGYRIANCRAVRIKRADVERLLAPIDQATADDELLDFIEEEA